MAWRTWTDVENAEPITRLIEVARGVSAALRQAFDGLWQAVRAHVADLHGLTRGQGPPAP